MKCEGDDDSREKKELSLEACAYFHSNGGKGAFLNPSASKESDLREKKRI